MVTDDGVGEEVDLEPKGPVEDAGQMTGGCDAVVDGGPIHDVRRSLGEDDIRRSLGEDDVRRSLGEGDVREKSWRSVDFDGSFGRLCRLTLSYLLS